MGSLRLLAYCLLLLLPVAPAAAGETPPVRVLASVEPVAMMLRQVLGDEARVATLLEPGQNPHNVSFTPGQASSARQADLVVWLGGEAEPQLAGLLRRRSGPSVAMLDQPGIRVRKDQDDDDHGHGHARLPLDPHLWLYPENMLRLARALPEHHEALGMSREQLEERVEAFAGELGTTVEQVRETLAPVRERDYLTHHDPWAYFAEAFELQRAFRVSRDLDVDPGTRAFARLARDVGERGLECILAEPESRRALLRRLCGHCRVVELDPLGRGVSGEHYSAFLEYAGAGFRACLDPDA